MDAITLPWGHRTRQCGQPRDDNTRHPYRARGAGAAAGCPAHLEDFQAPLLLHQQAQGVRHVEEVGHLRGEAAQAGLTRHCKPVPTPVPAPQRPALRPCAHRGAHSPPPARAPAPWRTAGPRGRAAQRGGAAAGRSGSGAHPGGMPGVGRGPLGRSSHPGSQPDLRHREQLVSPRRESHGAQPARRRPPDPPAALTRLCRLPASLFPGILSWGGRGERQH